jgi:mannose-6-phosphate isomerase
VIRSTAGTTKAVPEIILCTDGSLELSNGQAVTQCLHRGDAVFISADEGKCTLSGDGRIFRASVPE